MAHQKYRRRRNPFSPGGLNILAVKVGGGLAGGIAAATLPGALGASLSTGWGGVAAALVVAFVGSWALKGVSQNASEGFLIGGTLQSAGRISQILLNKNLVSFSLSGMRGYGPMQFPIPTPAYQVMGTPAIPASASVTSRTGSHSMGRYRGMSRHAA